MKGSNGIRRRTRKLRRKQREKGKTRIRDYLTQYTEGDHVCISINPSDQSIPHPRFQGKTGQIVGKQGKAYLVKIRDGGAVKTVIAAPQHLKQMR